MIKKHLTICSVLIFVAMVHFGCVQPSPDAGRVAELDQQAPSFTLRDLGGQEVSIEQFKGKIVLLDFWATWCGPCRMTMPLLERLQKEYSSALVLLAINMYEPIDLVREYVESQGLHAPTLLDEEGSVSSTYRVGGIPTQVLIDREGIVRFAQEGYNPATGFSELRREIEKLR